METQEIIVKTVGELKQLLQQYDDQTKLYGFNQDDRAWFPTLCVYTKENINGLIIDVGGTWDYDPIR